VIVGEHDLATPPELAAELAEGLSGAELVRVPGAHLSAVEAPEPFAAAVLAFLRAMA
jgi:3-oxoadipate enol-lactonase/4-carboxymuconolactone decarboxylase